MRMCDLAAPPARLARSPRMLRLLLAASLVSLGAACAEREAPSADSVPTDPAPAAVPAAPPASNAEVVTQAPDAVPETAAAASDMIRWP